MADNLDQMHQRARELQQAGMSLTRAFQIAHTEYLISNWPSGWGNDFVAILYGDFRAPDKDLHFPSIGITVEAKKLEKTVVRGALCQLRARVSIPEKSIESITNAAKRLDALLGIFSAMNWGTATGWWSFITHGSSAGAIGKTLDEDSINRVLSNLHSLPREAGQKVLAALYWMRSPRNMILQSYQCDVLQVYAGHWNAFECLVGVVCNLRPLIKLSDEEKDQEVKQFFPIGPLLRPPSTSVIRKSLIHG